jgi:hypothetical protein
LLIGSSILHKGDFIIILACTPKTVPMYVIE